MANSQRDKGHRWERKVRLQLRTVFPECETSRYASRLEDGNCIDFVNTQPLAIQAKNYKTKPNFKNELQKMKTDHLRVLAFKHNKLKGASGEYAVMYWADFLELLQKLL